MTKHATMSHYLHILSIDSLLTSLNNICIFCNSFFSDVSIEERILEYVKLKHVMSGLLRHDDGTSNILVIEKYASRCHHSF
jgi:thioredoxin-related protein